MNTTSAYQYNNRRICIYKDLMDVELWLYHIQQHIIELNQFIIIEKQLIKNLSLRNDIKLIRRENTLLMGLICKYEQQLKVEYENVNIAYDFSRIKMHKQYRNKFIKIIKSYNKIKIDIFSYLKKFSR